MIYLPQISDMLDQIGNPDRVTIRPQNDDTATKDR